MKRLFTNRILPVVASLVLIVSMFAGMTFGTVSATENAATETNTVTYTMQDNSNMSLNEDGTSIAAEDVFFGVPSIANTTADGGELSYGDADGDGVQDYGEKIVFFECKQQATTQSGIITKRVDLSHGFTFSALSVLRSYSLGTSTGNIPYLSFSVGDMTFKLQVGTIIDGTADVGAGRYYVYKNGNVVEGYDGVEFTPYSITRTYLNETYGVPAGQPLGVAAFYGGDVIIKLEGDTITLSFASVDGATTTELYSGTVNTDMYYDTYLSISSYNRNGANGIFEADLTYNEASYEDTVIYDEYYEVNDTNFTLTTAKLYDNSIGKSLFMNVKHTLGDIAVANNAMDLTGKKFRFTTQMFNWYANNLDSGYETTFKYDFGAFSIVAQKTSAKADGKFNVTINDSTGTAVATKTVELSRIHREALQAVGFRAISATDGDRMNSATYTTAMGTPAYVTVVGDGENVTVMYVSPAYEGGTLAYTFAASDLDLSAVTLKIGEAGAYSDREIANAYIYTEKETVADVKARFEKAAAYVAATATDEQIADAEARIAEYEAMTDETLKAYVADDVAKINKFLSDVNFVNTFLSFDYSVQDDSNLSAEGEKDFFTVKEVGNDYSASDKGYVNVTPNGTIVYGERNKGVITYFDVVTSNENVDLSGGFTLSTVLTGKQFYIGATGSTEVTNAMNNRRVGQKIIIGDLTMEVLHASVDLSKNNCIGTESPVVITCGETELYNANARESFTITTADEWTEFYGFNSTDHKAFYANSVSNAATTAQVDIIYEDGKLTVNLCNPFTGELNATLVDAVAVDASVFSDVAINIQTKEASSVTLVGPVELSKHIGTVGELKAEMEAYKTNTDYTEENKAAAEELVALYDSLENAEAKTFLADYVTYPKAFINDVIKAKYDKVAAYDSATATEEQIAEAEALIAEYEAMTDETLKAYLADSVAKINKFLVGAGVEGILLTSDYSTQEDSNLSAEGGKDFFTVKEVGNVLSSNANGYLNTTPKGQIVYGERDQKGRTSFLEVIKSNANTDLSGGFTFSATVAAKQFYMGATTVAAETKITVGDIVFDVVHGVYDESKITETNTNGNKDVANVTITNGENELYALTDNLANFTTATAATWEAFYGFTSADLADDGVKQSPFWANVNYGARSAIITFTYKDGKLTVTLSNPYTGELTSTLLDAVTVDASAFEDAAISIQFKEASGFGLIGPVELSVDIGTVGEIKEAMEAYKTNNDYTEANNTAAAELVAIYDAIQNEQAKTYLADYVGYPKAFINDVIKAKYDKVAAYDSATATEEQIAEAEALIAEYEAMTDETLKAYLADSVAKINKFLVGAGVEGPAYEEIFVADDYTASKADNRFAMYDESYTGTTLNGDKPNNSFHLASGKGNVLGLIGDITWGASYSSATYTSNKGYNLGQGFSLDLETYNIAQTAWFTLSVGDIKIVNVAPPNATNGKGLGIDGADITANFYTPRYTICVGDTAVGHYIEDATEEGYTTINLFTDYDGAKVQTAGANTYTKEQYLNIKYYNGVLTISDTEDDKEGSFTVDLSAYAEDLDFSNAKVSVYGKTNWSSIYNICVHSLNGIFNSDAVDAIDTLAANEATLYQARKYYDAAPAEIQALVSDATKAALATVAPVNFTAENEVGGNVTVAQTVVEDAVDTFAHADYIYAGEAVTITATADEGYTFRGWYDYNNRLVSRDAAYTVTEPSAARSYYYKALFVLNANDEGTLFTVTIYAKNGRTYYKHITLDSEVTSTSMDAILAADETLNAIITNVEGYTFSGIWKTNGTTITSSDAITGDITVTPAYTLDVTTYNIYVDGELNGSYEYNTKVTVTNENEAFTRWEQVESAEAATGITVSYSPEYSFFVSGERYLIGVVDGASVGEALINITYADLESSIFTVLSERALPDDCTFVEAGIIVTANADYYDKLTLADVDGVNVKKGTTSSTSANGQYMVKTYASDAFAAVAYLEYTDAEGNLVIMYSEKVSK